MNRQIKKQISKIRRAQRTRAKIFGTKQRPRLSVFKSNQNIFAQIINDENGQTLISAHTKQLKVKGDKSDLAKALGQEIAKKALEAKIKQVIFDRGASLYHGRIKAVAEGARQAGLEF